MSLNTAALADPTLITAVSRLTGSQSALIAIDAKLRDPAKGAAGGWDVYSHGGRRPTGRDLLQWVREATDRGAGEVLLTSIDHDGVGNGFAVEMLRAVTQAVSVPVIASGGAGTPGHFADAFEAGAAAALAATVFHFGSLKIGEVKQACVDRGLPMRWPI